MLALFATLVRREIVIAWRRPLDGLLPAAFFLIALTLFSLSGGPTTPTTSNYAPLLWLLTLLAALLSFDRMLHDDWRDGSLEILAFIPLPLEAVALAKSFAHWLLAIVPVIICAVVLLLLTGFPPKLIPVILLSLVLGTGTLMLIGIVGAALTLGARTAGGLLALTVLPLQIPILIVGSGAIETALAGNDPTAALSALGAFFLLSAAGAPWAAAAAIRAALD